jgi:hypothetical protein
VTLGNDHEAGMQMLVRIQCTEVPCVVRYERILSDSNPVNQMPVLQPAQAEEIDVIAGMAGLMGKSDQ